MRYMFLFGHGKSKDGKYNDVGAASPDGVAERDLVRAGLRDSLIKFSKQSKHEIAFYDGNAYRDRFLDYMDPTYSVIELHMDGSTKKDFGGGHVIIHADLTPDDMDKRLAAVIKMFFGWRLNDKLTGINGRRDLQNPNLAKRHGINYRLLELGHITNPTNYQTMKTEYDYIAKAILQAVTQESFADPADMKEEDTLYKIQAGAFRNYDNAVAALHKLTQAGFEAFIYPNKEEA